MGSSNANVSIKKIAIITDDGETISQHFGRAKNYLVVTLEAGQIVQRELREKLGHAHFAGQPHSHEHHHGLDHESHQKHLQMSDAIADCEAVLCGGMGRGAYDSLKTRGIRPVITELMEINQAIAAYSAGEIVDRIEKLH